MRNAPSNRWPLVPDGLGILAIGAQIYLLVRWFVPDDGSRLISGGLAYLILAALALYFWHKEEPPFCNLVEPSDWVVAILASLVAGSVSFGIDAAVGIIGNPKLSLIEAGMRAGSPFGFPLTLMLCPGFTTIAVAGLLRSLLVRSATTSPGQP